MVNRLKESPLLQIFILIMLAFIWGSSFILMKKGLESFPPAQVGTVRLVFAFLVMLPIALKHIKPTYVKNWKLILITGLIGNVGPAILFAVAQTKISSSLAGILNSLTPIFTLVAGLFFYASKIRGGQIIGLILGLAGCVMITFIGAEGSLGDFNFFALFVVIATICYGVSGNMIKYYFNDIRPLPLTALIMFSNGPIALVYLLTTDFPTRLMTVDGAWMSLWYIFLLGAFGTAFALMFFYKLIQMTSAVFGSVVTYLIPIVAVIWGVIDGETLYPLHFVGMALIIGGVYIVNKFK